MLQKIKEFMSWPSRHRYEKEDELTLCGNVSEHRPGLQEHSFRFRRDLEFALDELKLNKDLVEHIHLRDQAMTA